MTSAPHLGKGKSCPQYLVETHGLVGCLDRMSTLVWTPEARLQLVCHITAEPAATTASLDVSFGSSHVACFTIGTVHDSSWLCKYHESWHIPGIWQQIRIDFSDGISLNGDRIALDKSLRENWGIAEASRETVQRSVPCFLRAGP